MRRIAVAMAAAITLLLGSAGCSAAVNSQAPQNPSSAAAAPPSSSAEGPTPASPPPTAMTKLAAETLYLQILAPEEQAGASSFAAMKKLTGKGNPLIAVQESQALAAWDAARDVADTLLLRQQWPDFVAADMDAFVQADQGSTSADRNYALAAANPAAWQAAQSQTLAEVSAWQKKVDSDLGVVRTTASASASTAAYRSQAARHPYGPLRPG